MKIAVIYHSVGGNTKAVAQIIAKGVKVSDEIEVSTMSIGKMDSAFIEDSKAVIIGSPTYYGTFSWQIKKWFDTSKIDLEGKLGSVFVTENYLGGGADVAELGMIGHMLIKGMIDYSSGFTKEGPITHYGAVRIKSGDEWQNRRAEIIGKRIGE
jgi:NAD(P)H dehydrogenase (quinone)